MNEYYLRKMIKPISAKNPLLPVGVDNDIEIGQLKVEVCEGTGKEVVMQYEGNNNWLCHHTTSAKQDALNVELFKKGIYNKIYQ